MLAFEVPDASPEVFVDRVERTIVERGLGGHVHVALRDDELVVSFRWLGTSHLSYRVETVDDGFRATLSSTRMAPMHAPFRARFEGQLERVLLDLGARLPTA